MSIFKKQKSKKYYLYCFYRNELGMLISVDGFIFKTIDELLTYLYKKVCYKYSSAYLEILENLYKNGKQINTNNINSSTTYELSAYTHQKLRDYFDDENNINYSTRKMLGDK